MIRAKMKIALHAFTSWLRDALPPSGKPFTYDLEADGIQVIESVVTTTTAPDFKTVELLDQDSLRVIYEWLFPELGVANAGHRGWGLAAQCLRLLAIEHLDDIAKRIQDPVVTVGNKITKPV